MLDIQLDPREPRTLSSGLTIRNALGDDIKSILAIYNDVLLTTNAIYEERPRTEKEVLDWYDSRVSVGFPFFVCEWEGHVVGYCSYGRFRDRACYQPTVEHAIHIASPFRGRGFGSQMLAHLISDARCRNFHSMIAGIDSKNEGSIALHAKFGFRPVAHIPQVALKFDRWLDLVLMQLMLNPIPAHRTV